MERIEIVDGKIFGTDWQDLGVHEFAKAMPFMQGEELDGLITSIFKAGFKGDEHPIVIFEGKVLDGRSRLSACVRLQKQGALPNIEPTFVLFEGTQEEARQFVVRENVHRRHLSREAYTKLVEAELKADPTRSNRTIAKILGKSDPHAVANAREKMEKAGEIPIVEGTVGEDGKIRPAKGRGRPRKNPAAVETPTTLDPITEDVTQLNNALAELAPEVIAYAQEKGRSIDTSAAPAVEKKPVTFTHPNTGEKVNLLTVTVGKDLDEAAILLSDFYTYSEWQELMKNVKVLMNAPARGKKKAA